MDFLLSLQLTINAAAEAAAEIETGGHCLTFFAL
jgi:hypothetical protein